MTDSITSTPSSDATARLADKALTDPAGGGGLFFAATPSGTPLGLAGFGFGLLLLSFVNAGWLAPGAAGVVVAVAFGLSAVALLTGGVMDFRAGALFGGVWQVLYAGFWLSLGLLLQFYGPQVTAAAGADAFNDAFGAYVLVWAALTAYLAVGAYYIAKPAFACFALLVVLELVIGFAYLGGASESLLKVGGYLGIIDALLAWYVSATLVINTTAGRNLLPLWPYPYNAT